MPALAPAKINLSLEIVGKRSDGFHELVSVMQEVTLFDELVFAEADDLILEAHGECGPESENLVLRAARLLRQTVEIGKGAAIGLRKQIPTGAGLGGGSSDGAAALMALNRLWDAGCHCETLSRMAAFLGSDVPFFLTGGTALVTGRGEHVVPVPFPRTAWYVLTNPGLHVSTARVFTALPPTEWSSGSHTRKFAEEIRDGDPSHLGVNGLAPTLFALYPEAEACFQAADQAAPGQTWVSGSGPTVVSRCAGPHNAERVAAQLHRLGYTTFVVRNYPTEDRDLPCRA